MQRTLSHASVGRRGTHAKPCANLTLIGKSAESEVILETVNLMHALMQDGHNPDVAIREMTPVDEMTLVSKEEPFNTKLGWDRFRCDTVRCNLVEGGEQAGDVFLGLIISPPVTGVAVDVI